MANPLKIYTILTASAAAKFEQGVDLSSQKVTGLADGTAATDAVAYGQVTSLSSSIKSYVDAADGVLDSRITSVSGAIKTYVDAQDSALSGAMKSYVDAQDSALSGAMKSYVDAQDLALSGAFKSYVDAQDLALSGAFDSRLTALSGAASSSLLAEATARIAEDLTFLKLDGTRAMAAALNMGGFDISSAKSGSFSGDVTVGGNLQVNGALTYINTTNLDVTDKLVTLAKGAANATAANGGGIELEGAGANLTYASATDRWVANKDMEVADAFYAGGQKLLEKEDNGAVVGAKLSYSNYGYVGIANYVDGDGVLIGGSDIVGIETVDFTVVATSSFARNATFQAQVAMDAALKLSGSAFSYIATPIVSNKYDVNDAIRALDVAVSGAANQAGNDLNTLKSNYDALRQVVTGTLSSGTALLTLAGAQFAAGQIDNIALDVMIDADNTGYTNDLVAIKMFVDGAVVKVQIDAPAAASAKYRLIAVNEADGKL